MKPIDCPTRPQSLAGETLARETARETDAEQWMRLFQLQQTLAEITPVQLTTATLPPMAAKLAGQKIDLEAIWQQLQQLQQRQDLVLLEAWGGLGAPLTSETTVADLAWDWRIPTVLVVPVQPGAVAQAVAHAALAQQARVHLKGILLNAVQPWDATDWERWVPIDLLQSLTQKPVLGVIPHLADPTDLNKLAQIASNWDLEYFLPMLKPLVSTS